jgi:prepilin-type processing-associated H-X9-DG protein
MDQDKPPVAPDVGQSERPRPKPLEKYCRIALLLSFVSCLFPLIAAAAIGMAIAGIVRMRKRGTQGAGYATIAIVLSLLGTLFFIKIAIGLPATRAAAINGACQVNLRTIGQMILMYEADYRNAKGYSLDDLVKFSKTTPPSLVAQQLWCLNFGDRPAPTPGLPTPSSYILLTPLEPFSKLRRTTIIAIELGMHHIPTDGEFPERNGLNVLFADGRVDMIPPDKAASEIEKSLNTSKP